MLVVSARNVGDHRTPHETKALRRNVIEMAMRLGQPVVWRHRFTVDEVAAGSSTLQLQSGPMTIALQRCPACYDEYNESGRGDCPVCFGITITSTETSDVEYISSSGRITTTATANPAPVYRGFGPSVLTWVLQPDVLNDNYKLSPEGVMTLIESARVYAPWTPLMEDNDFMANVILRPDSATVEKITEIYELKGTTPQSVRGHGQTARGREFMVGQSFEMAVLPSNHPYAGLTVEPAPSTNRDAGRMRAVFTATADEDFN